MSWGEEQKKEIETIRERKITVKLSDADCDRLARKCGEHGLTIGELIENFVGDLVGGTYSNGSDERDYADQWFERCWFGMFPEPTLLNHLLNLGYEPEHKLVSGLHCEPDTVKDEMQATKELWEKTGGRTYKHFVQSYHKDEKITPEQAHRNALQLAENTSAWKGFEVLVATHKDKKHIHTHFIVNSVNFEDGHKLQWSSADLQELKERCNAQSREQGLHVSEKGKTFEGAEREETVAWKKETYQLLKQAEQGKVKSYVQDIALAVLDCKETATSRESFIRLMNERGYGVDWQDSHKYITYTDLARKQAGEKACKIRNNKLEKYYNMGFGKEELEHEFERNARTAEVRAGKSERTDPRTEPSEPDRAGEQPAEGSLSFVERELRGIDEAVKSRTSKGRAEQAERRRAEQAAHQRAEEASRAVREQQRTTSERHISRNWEPER